MEQIENFLKHWPRTAVCMLAGALIGCVLWMFLPQQYIASVRLDLGIDFNRTGKLDELEEARLIGIVEDTLHSDGIMEKVYEKSEQTDFRSFYEQTQIYRTNAAWSLTITGTDPEEISRLARVWLDEAYDLLYERRAHSVRAEALRNELDSLTRCVQDMGGTPATSVCETDPEEIFRQIGIYTDAILEEEKAANGLSAALLIGEKNPKQLELRPLSRNLAANTLLGAFCGLLVSFAIVWLPVKDRKQQ